MHDERQWVPIDRDRRRLVRAAARLLGAAEAEDAVQDACVRALEAEALEVRLAPAWLLTVVRHLAIDRLRRRDRMRQWLAAEDAEAVSPSAEVDAARAEEVGRALRLLAVRLSPADGALVLLHEVFGAEHAEIAEASGGSEAASRQRLRRALARLRPVERDARRRTDRDREACEDAVFRRYLLSLQSRDPQALWAMLAQPPVEASAGPLEPVAPTVSATRATVCRIVQTGGQLGLVLTLDGVALCVLPLGVRPVRDAALAST